MCQRARRPAVRDGDDLQQRLGHGCDAHLRQSAGVRLVVVGADEQQGLHDMSAASWSQTAAPSWVASPAMVTRPAREIRL